MEDQGLPHTIICRGEVEQVISNDVVELSRGHVTDVSILLAWHPQTSPSSSSREPYLMLYHAVYNPVLLNLHTLPSLGSRLLSRAPLVRVVTLLCEFGWVLAGSYKLANFSN